MRRQDVLEAGRNIQQQLIVSERSIDEGLIAQAQITAALLTARIKLGLNACAEHGLITEAGAILTNAFAFREQLIAHHERLSGLSRRLGVDPTSFGDSGDKVVIKPADGPQLVHDIAA